METVYSALGLLNAIRNRGPVPENDIRFNQEKIFLLINEEMRNTVFPMMLALNNEYFLTSDLINVADHSNDALYPLPQRAYARTLRELRYIDTGNNVYNVPRVNLNDSYFFANNSAGLSYRSPLGVYFYNDAFKIVGNVQGVSGQLELTYVLRPPKIAEPDTQGRVLGFPVNSTENLAASIVSVDSSTDTFTVTSALSLPANFPVIFTTAGTLPGGMSAGQIYWLTNVTATTFQISEASGGGVLNLTSNGSGALSLVVYAKDSAGAATNNELVTFRCSASAFADYSLADTNSLEYKLFDVIRITTGAVLANNVAMRVDSATSAPSFVDILGKTSLESFNNTQNPYNDPEVYIVPAEQSGYVTLPLEAQELLIIAVCQRFYEALGYTDDFAVAEKQMSKIKDQLQSIYAERLSGEPQIISSRSGLGAYTLYGRRGRGNRRRLTL